MAGQFIEVGGEPKLKKIRKATSDTSIISVPVQQPLEGIGFDVVEEVKEEIVNKPIVVHAYAAKPPINKAMLPELYNVIQYSKKNGKMRKDILASGPYSSCMKVIHKYQTSGSVIKIERA